MNKEPTLEEAVRSVREAAGAAREDDGVRASWAVIETAAVEDPHALAPHLRALFPLLDKAVRILEGWRAADAETVVFLFSQLDDPDQRTRAAAKRALLETRRRDVIERLQGDPRAGGLFLKGVDMESGPNGLRALCSETPLHLAFSPEMVLAIQRRPQFKPLHTWVGFDPAGPIHRFGGVGAAPCELCREPIDHLLTMDPVPPSVGVSLRRLTIGVCLSCVFEQNGSGGAYFVHDAQGRPSVFQDEPDPEPIPPEFPSEPLVETGVCLVDLGPRWQLQPWGSADGGHNLNRVGGLPSWVQGPGYEKCPSCATTMTFLMQLDSGLVTTDGKNYDWANGGMLFVTWCDSCRISHFEIQNT